jgi:hypothetical protein
VAAAFSLCTSIIKPSSSLADLRLALSLFGEGCPLVKRKTKKLRLNFLLPNFSSTKGRFAAIYYYSCSYDDDEGQL